MFKLRNIEKRKARLNECKIAPREASRDSGVDLDSPSVASNYMDSKKKKKKETKSEIGHKFVTKKPLKMATAAEQLADVKSANRTNLPKFKFGNPQSFDLRRAIQQKVLSGFRPLVQHENFV